MKLIIDDGSGIQKVLPIESFVEMPENTETQENAADSGTN